MAKNGAQHSMWTFYESVTVVRSWGNTGNFPKAIAHHERHRRPERCFLSIRRKKKKHLRCYPSSKSASSLYRKNSRHLLFTFPSLMACTGQQLFMLVLSHLFSSFFNNTAQPITPPAFQLILLFVISHTFAKISTILYAVTWNPLL
jgi:hypothetical protein